MQVALDDYPWAAAVATELANTAPEVWRGADHLPDLAALAAFADHHDSTAVSPAFGGSRPALGDIARRARGADLDAVHALRYVVRGLIDRPDRAHLIAGATSLTASAAGATLLSGAMDDRHTRWALTLHPAATITDALALVCGVGVLGVVHSLGEQRFRPCGAPTCRGAFIDTTRPGRRRYCMPALCGNRTNVANHRARRTRRAIADAPGS